MSLVRFDGPLNYTFPCVVTSFHNNAALQNSLNVNKKSRSAEYTAQLYIVHVIPVHKN